MGARRIRGLTMIELLVALAIGAILTAMAAPSLRDFLIRNRSAAMTNELTASVLRARNEAINRNTCVVMCRSTNVTGANPSCAATGDNWREGWIVFADRTCAGTAVSPATAPDLVSASGPFNADFSLVKSGINTNRLVFSPTGSARLGDAGRFDLRYLTTTRSSNRGVCLNAQGRTRIVAFGESC